MKSHSRAQIRSLSHDFLLRAQYQPQRCSRESPPGRLQRIQALDAVLPRPSSPNSPVFALSDREMRRVLEDARDAMAACEMSCFYVSGKREKTGKGESLGVREIPKSLFVQLSIGRKRDEKALNRGFRYGIEKEKRLSSKILTSSAEGLPPIRKGYRLFHKRRLDSSLLF